MNPTQQKGNTMRFEEIYKSHRSAFIDGVFVGVALAVVSKYVIRKLVEKVDQDRETLEPIVTH